MAEDIGLSQFFFHFLIIAEYSLVWINEQKSSQSSSIVKLWFFFLPILGSLDSERLHQLSFILLATHDRVW